MKWLDLEEKAKYAGTLDNDDALPEIALDSGTAVHFYQDMMS